MNIACVLFGHRWEKVNNDLNVCSRCRKVEYVGTPLLTQDEIIQDTGWYKAQEKEPPPRHTKD